MLTEIDPNLHDNYRSRPVRRNIKVSSKATGKRKGNLRAELLSKNWNTSLDSTKQTLKVTAQGEVELLQTQAYQQDFRQKIINYGTAGYSVTGILISLMLRL